MDRWICVCLLAALPLAAQPPAAEEQPVPYELANPGFEAGRQGWSTGSVTRFDASAEADAAIHRSGAASLHVVNRDQGVAPWLTQTVANLQPGATYALRGWFRGVAGGKATAALKIEFYNDARQNTSGAYTRLAADQAEWQPIVLEMVADPDSTRATLLLRVYGAGEVWFDDIEFVRLRAAAPVVLTPPRQAVAAAKAVELPLSLFLRDPWPGAAPTPQVALTGPAGPVAGAGVGGLALETPQRGALTVRLPALPPGSYTLTVTVPAGQATTGVFVPPANRRPANLTEDGTLLVDGKPFFPIGLYHVSVREYPLIAAQGFNAVQGAWSRDPAQFKAHLDAAQAAGLMSDVPFYAGGQVAKNREDAVASIRQFADHPAVLNWKIIDEPDVRPDVVDEVLDSYVAFRAADNEHPVLLTIASPGSYGYWANFCDILQIDPYPVPDRPLSMVADYTRMAKAVLQPWQNLTAVLQSGWVMGANGPANQPTYDQARSMLYQALIEGAKGIFWYSFNDPGWHLPNTPLWPRFREINAETAELGRLVTTAQPVGDFARDNEAVLAAAWIDAQGLSVLATNPTSEPQTATVKVAASGRPRVVRGEGQVEPVQGGLKLTLPAVGSVWVRVER